MPGVDHVDVDFPNKTATAMVDEEVFDSAGALAALVDAGYAKETNLQ